MRSRAYGQRKLGRVVGGFALAAAWLAVPAAVALMTASSAKADSSTATLGMHGDNGASSVTITAGDSITFKSGAAPTHAGATLFGFYVTIRVSEVPGVPVGTTLKGSATKTATFNDPGTFLLKWDGRSGALGTKVSPIGDEFTYMTITVNPVVVPTTPASTPPATDPGQTTPATSTGTSTGTTAPPSGGTTTTVGGHPVVIATLPNGQIQTFPAGPGLGNPLVFPTGVNRGGTTGPLPSGFPSQYLTGLPTPSSSTSAVAAGIEPPNNNSHPPTALAIIAIVALAGVTSFYAYTYLMARPASIE